MNDSLAEQIVEAIRKGGPLRTPELALVFAMSERELDARLAPLCAPSGPLVSCDVEVASRHVKEYRCSAIGGGKLNDVWNRKPGRPRTTSAKPEPAFGDPQAVKQALAARFQSAPPAPPAPKPTQPRKEADAPMTAASRIIAVITKRGPMTVPQIRSILDEPNVATTCSQLIKKKQLLKLAGGSHSSVYGLPGQKAPAVQQAKPVRGAKRGGRPSMRKQRAALPAPAVVRESGAFRPAIASDGALLLMGAATPGELSPSETRVLAEFLRRVDRTGVRV